MNQTIFLIGLPASGKTTFGRQLANDLSIPFTDLDAEIEKTENRSIPEIFKQSGESYFRKVEQKVLTSFLNFQEDMVIATGGGTPCFFDNMEQMNANGTTIYLDVPLSEIEDRLATDQSRPVMKQTTLPELLTKRAEWYALAKFKVSDYQSLRAIFD